MKALFYLVALIFASSMAFPIGDKSNSSIELQEENSKSMEEQLLDVGNEPEEEQGIENDEDEDQEEEDAATRKKRGLDSSERSQETEDLDHGIHKRHAEHHEAVKSSHHETTSGSDTHGKNENNIKKRNVDGDEKNGSEHHSINKRSENDHNNGKRSTDFQDYHNEKRSEHSTPDEHHIKRRNTDGSEHHVELKTHEKEPEHHIVKRSHDEAKEHHAQKRSHSDDTEHHVQKRSHQNEPEHHVVKRSHESVPEHHAIKRSHDAETEKHSEHAIVKREPEPEPGQKSNGHRQPRSTDQGNEEDEPEDEISPDAETAEEESDSTRRRRHVATNPPPKFASDVESPPHAKNSVGATRLNATAHTSSDHFSAIRVKRVSRAGSSHKVRTFNKNRGNSKAGGAEQDAVNPSSSNNNNPVVPRNF